MTLEEIRFYEGNNIKRHNHVAKVTLSETNIYEAKEKGLLYIELCKEIGFSEKIIDIEKYNEKINLWVSYSDEEAAEFIIKEIVGENLAKEEIIKKVALLKKSYFLYKNIKKAKEKNIPVVRIDKDVYQIGYGKNSVHISVNDEGKKEITLDEIKPIPIIAVTGTNGKTTTARLIHNLLTNLGYNTGLTSTGFIMIGNEIVEKGDTTGFLSARRVLQDKGVEAAVFETARGGIIRNGLGYENIDVAVFTSLSEDHIGIDGVKNMEDLAEIKTVVLEEVKKEGKWVIRAQKHIIDSSRKSFHRVIQEGRYDKAFENKVCMFEKEMNSFMKEHIDKGGEAFYVEEDYIIHNSNFNNRKLVNVKELPFTHYGISTGNILNVMAAIAAISTLYNDVDNIINILKKINCDLETNPGRQNILDFQHFKVIIDYGHNKESYEEIYSIVKRLKPEKVTSIITAPGDRTDSHIKELGYIAGRESDYIIIREQLDQRGSSLGRVANLMTEGAMEAGFLENHINYISDAGEALVFSIRKAVEGEVIVLYTEELQGVLKKLNTVI